MARDPDAEQAAEAAALVHLAYFRALTRAGCDVAHALTLTVAWIQGHAIGTNDQPPPRRDWE